MSSVPASPSGNYYVFREVGSSLTGKIWEGTIASTGTPISAGIDVNVIAMGW